MPSWLAFLQPILDAIKPVFEFLNKLFAKKPAEQSSEEVQKKRNDELNKEIEDAKNRHKPN